MKSLIFASAVLAASAGVEQAAAPAPDQSNQAAPAATTEPADKDADKVICRNVESTATRLGRTRVCMTRAEWAESSRSWRSRDRQLSSIV
jgi:hypothetical protein